MKIIFIYRDKHFQEHDFKSIFSKNYCKCDFGFFLLSLKNIADIKFCSLRDFIFKNIEEYDHVVIDSKIKIDYNENEYLPLLKSKIKTMVSIFLSYDRIFNYSDIVGFEKYLNVKSFFVPNLLKNIDEYQITNIIKKKLFPTYYGFGFLPIKYEIKKNQFLIDQKDKKNKFSIFYSGTVDNIMPHRKVIIKFLNRLNIDKKKIINYQKNFDGNKLSSLKYIQYSIQSRINLVLSGNQNNIAYRFYEMGLFKKFFLIDHYFLNYHVSTYFDEVEEFVFFNTNDLKKKINFFLSHQDQIKRIKKKQINTFNYILNPNSHGKEIYQFLNS
tara:strand:- start:52 stop:1032 length:981 start_codon:yes stop_codon:yes gene_type:complete